MEQDLRRAVNRLSADGGASANNFLMQFQADVLGVPVVRPAVMETTAFGAACLAGLYCGFYGSLAGLRDAVGAFRVFRPACEEARRVEKLKSWEDALARAMYRVR